MPLISNILDHIDLQCDLSEFTELSEMYKELCTRNGFDSNEDFTTVEFSWLSEEDKKEAVMIDKRVGILAKRLGLV